MGCGYDLKPQEASVLLQNITKPNKVMYELEI